MMRRWTAIVAALVLVLAACEVEAVDEDVAQETTTTEATTTTTAAETTTTTAAETTTTAAETTTTGAQAEGAAVTTEESDLGTILVDGEGNTLYILTADSPGESTCQDQCASAWPPFTTDGEPQAEGEADAALLGTLSREDGSTQVTYGDWPLYYFSGDEAPGDVNGQGIESFGGTWWVIGPDGEPIED